MLPLKKYLAEFLGSALLCLIGVVCIEWSTVNCTQASLYIVSLGFGMAVTTAILLFGGISGAHINPAVSLAFYVNKSISLAELIFYTVFQILGCVVGTYFANLIVPSVALGATLPSVDILHALTLEVLLTAMLMYVIFRVIQPQSPFKPYAAWCIGGMVGLNTFLVGGLTAVSMNPARSLGPALVTQNYQSIWIYIIAPVVGALLAYFIHQWQQKKAS